MRFIFYKERKYKYHMVRIKTLTFCTKFKNSTERFKAFLYTSTLSKILSWFNFFVVILLGNIPVFVTRIYLLVNVEMLCQYFRKMFLISVRDYYFRWCINQFTGCGWQFTVSPLSTSICAHEILWSISAVFLIIKLINNELLSFYIYEKLCSYICPKIGWIS